jgi:hypothetical protein
MGGSLGAFAPWAIAVLLITLFFVWLAYEYQKEKTRRLEIETEELHRKVETIPQLVKMHSKEVEERLEKDLTALKLELTRVKRAQ